MRLCVHTYVISFCDDVIFFCVLFILSVCVKAVNTSVLTLCLDGRVYITISHNGYYRVVANLPHFVAFVCNVRLIRMGTAPHVEHPEVM